MEQQQRDRELIKEVQEIKHKVSLMFYALMGNELTKDGGLIARIDDIEKRIEKHEDRIEKTENKQELMTTYQKIIWCIGGGIGSAILGYIFKII